MRQVRGVTAAGVLLAVVFAMAGCATPLTDEDMPGRNVVYVRGGTQGEVEAAPSRVIEAAEAVMTQMRMEIDEPVVEDTETGEVHRLNAISASGRRVYVTAAPIEDESGTQLRVRIDTFGDAQLSNELYRRIASRLQ